MSNNILNLSITSENKTKIESQNKNKPITRKSNKTDLTINYNSKLLNS